MNKIGFEQIRVYVSGENIAYWSPITKVTNHLDPESCFDRDGNPTSDLNNTSYPFISNSCYISCITALFNY